TIGGYAHESGRSVILVVNKWDLLTAAPTNGQRTTNNGHSPAKTLKPSQKLFEQQLRDRLKFLDYSPVVFLSAAAGTGIDGLYRAISKVTRERRKRITTGEMNRFLIRTDFQQAPVPLARRVKIYYITQAAVAPPTFVLFTDKPVPLHFAFERFL